MRPCLSLPRDTGDTQSQLSAARFHPDIESLVHLEIDIYWAVTGGITSGEGVDDPEGFTPDVIRSAQQRVLHRDPATGDIADLGTGVIDFARIFRGHQVMEYIVETTPLT
ncbi:hypothetical protein [Micromonospora sp. CNB394]|uniref:hypothetical protein n=1 Tax=Micromonospora sp. CNB394 TaxID=1169151 RepID=UPI00037423E9|nr:hypothetical protein [Micromonospora sp. CNB394]